MLSVTSTDCRCAASAGVAPLPNVFSPPAALKKESSTTPLAFDGGTSWPRTRTVTSQSCPTCGSAPGFLKFVGSKISTSAGLIGSWGFSAFQRRAISSWMFRFVASRMDWVCWLWNSTRSARPLLFRCWTARGSLCRSSVALRMASASPDLTALSKSAMSRFACWFAAFHAALRTGSAVLEPGTRRESMSTFGGFFAGAFAPVEPPYPPPPPQL